MTELFTARWPILDQDQPISRLTVQAAAEVDALAAEQGVRITGPVAYSVHGERLVAVAEAEPLDVAASLPEPVAQALRLLDLGWTYRRIAEAVGRSSSWVYTQRLKHRPDAACRAPRAGRVSE